MERDDELEFVKEAKEDGAWIRENWKEIKEKYGGKLIAVKGKKVMASDESKERLLRKVEARGIQGNEVLVQYIFEDNEIIVF